MTQFKLATFTALTGVTLSIFTAHAQQDYGVHDPAGLVKEDERYYTFYTSNGVECTWSTDLCTWHRGGKIFPTGFPDWINTYVSGFRGHFWAPAVFYMNSRWHVYYSCSSFGSRGSAIGLAATPSLINPEWEDQGMVVYTDDSSDHNAIDADIMRHDGRIWLVYGSFWSGIVMTELDTTTGKPIDRSDLHYVADRDPEAAFAMHHGEYYYLFFNRGKCCDGVNSTYYINVGRSENPTGPFIDKEGKQTSSGGGTVILKTEGRFIGPGHFGYIADNGREYMSYHYYDRNQNGMSKLKISTVSWEDGWPVVNTGFDPCNAPPVDDCAGVENGSAYLDGCGVCVGGTTGKEPCKLDCSGEWGGEAYTDTCGACIGGTTNLSPCTGFIEGEEALESDGETESANEGYLGEGYFNFENESGTSATWELCAETESIIELVVRYANGTAEDRDLSLTINGTVSGLTILIPSTSSWTNWKYATVNVPLAEGKNQIILTSLSSQGGPNIDRLSFSDSRVQRCGTGAKAAFHRNTSQHATISYVNGFVTLHTVHPGSVELFLYTVSGRLTDSSVSKKVSAGTNHLKLTIAGLSKGIYLLVVKEHFGTNRHEQLIRIW